MKNSTPRTYSEEEKSFIEKYGETALYKWEYMDDSLKKKYKELEAYYEDFATLYSEHYEDLKLYALMYRNVPLYNCANDVYSILCVPKKQNYWI